MSNRSDSPTPSRARRRQGQAMTPQERREKQDAFLALFGMEANVTAAAQELGLDRDTIYDWKQRYTDFAQRFAAAEQEANDHIDHEIYRRGVLGWEEPLVSAGKFVCMVTKYSDAMLTLLAKSRMPKYREKQHIDVSATLATMAGQAKDELLADLAQALAHEDQDPSH